MSSRAAPGPTGSVHPVPPPTLTPPGAVVAGVLGMVSAVLALVIGSFLVWLWSSVEGSPAFGVAVVVMPIGVGHLAGAILVLCGRSPALLVLTALPLAGVAVLQVVVTAGSVLVTPSLTSALPLLMGLTAGTAATLAAVTCRTGGGSSPRRPGALALPAEPWWP
jgi:hypothetical protein